MLQSCCAHRIQTGEWNCILHGKHVRKGVKFMYVQHKKIVIICGSLSGMCQLVIHIKQCMHIQETMHIVKYIKGNCIVLYCTHIAHNVHDQMGPDIVCTNTSCCNEWRIKVIHYMINDFSCAYTLNMCNSKRVLCTVQRCITLNERTQKNAKI